MPYIAQEVRQKLNASIDNLIIELDLNSKGDEIAGNLNYAFSRIIRCLARDKPNYARFALLKGVLSDVIDEFNRRVVHPYEDKKIEENGDL